MTMDGTCENQKGNSLPKKADDDSSPAVGDETLGSGDESLPTITSTTTGGDVEAQKSPFDMSDRFIIEELPNDELNLQDHDQLPSVEEIKASLAHQPIKRKTSKKVLAYGAMIVLFPIVILIIILATKSGSSGGGKEEDLFVPVGRTEEIIQFLFDSNASPLPALRDPKFPQHKAALFVADGDVYEMDHTESPEAARRFIERYALAVMYYHFDGAHWNYQLDFFSGIDHCEWSQTFETASLHSEKTIRMGVTCNEDGYVTALNLAQNNLQGHHVPDEIKLFQNLETLHLYFNKIEGAFPEVFREMTNLKSIAMMQNGLQGTLPSWIGEMTQLTTLGLGNNNLHGLVPESISKLHRLRILGLDDNNALSGNLDLFKGMSSLQALYLEDNAFTGQLPVGRGSWPNMAELDISNNMIDGNLPVSLLNNQNMIVLDVHRNLLDGPFPNDIYENTNLKVLAIRNNMITGTLPDRLAFLKNLRHVDVAANGLTGTIPDNVSMLTNLRYFSTSHNSFSRQPIPNFSEMQQLQDLAMKGNQLTGTIPDWVGGLSNMKLLDLDANELTGSIPTWIGLMSNLNYLLLNRNDLGGTLPTQFVHLRQLQVLLLDGNNIHGNTNAVCNAQANGKNLGGAFSQLTHFTADCYPGTNGERPEIDCRCCTKCCVDSDTSCNNYAWTSYVDPVWEYGYLRPNYVFSLANAPAEISKEGDANPVDPIDNAFSPEAPAN